MIHVELTPDEIYGGAMVAVHRKIASIFNRKKPCKTSTKDTAGWEFEIESALAELAVAKVYDRYWTGSIFDREVARYDVSDWQVRHTAHRNGALLIYEEDFDEDMCFLVVGLVPKYTIVGRIRIRDAKDKRYWKKNCKTPCYWVPQTALTPCREDEPDDMNPKNWRRNNQLRSSVRCNTPQ